MVATARHCVIYVRNKDTSLIIPGAVAFEECEIPKDALWVDRQRAVQLVVAQKNVLGRCVNFDEHDGGVDCIRVVNFSVVTGRV